MYSVFSIQTLSHQMASNKQTSTGKPLNPMASPYHKVSLLTHHHYHVYFTNFPPYHHHILPPVVPYFPPPLCVSKKKKMGGGGGGGGLSPFAPVPLGPRFPKSPLPSRSQKKMTRRHLPDSSSSSLGGSCGATSKLAWVPKQDSKQKSNTTTVNVNVSVSVNVSVAAAAAKKQQQKQQQPPLKMGGTRWKNKSGGYQEILPLNENTTSLMIKNIPNKYTRELMVETLDNHCKNDNKNTPDGVSAYDFLYLPIDFHRRVNAGFAFVNFTNPEAALRFRDAFHGKRWDLFGSSKIAEISRARIQGKEALICHCNSLDFSNGSEEDMPVYFEPARDGSAQDCCYKMFTVGSFSH